MKYLDEHSIKQYQTNTVKVLKTKIRLDKFLKYYDSEYLTSLYRKVWNN